MLVNAIKEIPIDLNTPRLIKVNLPSDIHGFMSGNGEGCWAYIRNAEDFDKYNSTGQFEVILMNDSIYYLDILRYGHVIIVDGKRDKRPVLNKEWIEKIMEELDNNAY
jgi:hypothetical protein